MTSAVMAESRIRCSCLRENQAFVREANSPKLFVGHLTVLIKQFWVSGFETCSIARRACSRSRRRAHHPERLEKQASEDCCVSKREKTCDHYLLDQCEETLTTGFANRRPLLRMGAAAKKKPPPKAGALKTHGVVSLFPTREFFPHS